MKKNLKITLVLTLISAICATLIACVNLFTSGIIQKNNELKKEKLCQEVFSDYSSTFEKSETITTGFVQNNIKELILAYSANGKFLGYIYIVEGANAYGKIKLLIGVTKEENLAGVRFITNEQSFSSETEKHLKNQYKENMTEENIDNLDLTNPDVTSGATYASKLIRSLVKSAFEDVKTRKGGIA